LKYAINNDKTAGEWVRQNSSGIIVAIT